MRLTTKLATRFDSPKQRDYQLIISVLGGNLTDSVTSSISLDWIIREVMACTVS